MARLRPFTYLALALAFLSLSTNCDAQMDTCRVRKQVYHGGLALASGGSLAALGALWYAKHSTGKFHPYNDNAEWLQMDKVGHAFAGYQLSSFASTGAAWACYSRKNEVLMGLVVPMVYLSGIEMMDGFSRGWGASWGDLGADLLGTMAYWGQEKAWGEQRLRLKWSFHSTPYAGLRPDVLGEGWQEMVKDYNGQTYWVSAGLSSLGIIPAAPEWLSLSFGYSADGMTGGHTNVVTHFPDGNGQVIQRRRQYYLSPDIDLDRIRLRRPWQRTVLKALSFLKFPMPALEYQQGKGLSVHALYF